MGTYQRAMGTLFRSPRGTVRRFVIVSFRNTQRQAGAACLELDQNHPPHGLRSSAFYRIHSAGTFFGGTSVGTYSKNPRPTNILMDLLIPESGPHLIFLTLFYQNAIPFSILLASSVVQDGHGMLPMLAESRLDFFKIKGINLFVGLCMGLTGYLTGW